MKKILMSLIIMLVAFPLLTVGAKEKVKVYLFWGDGCPHCEDAKTFFNGLEKEIGDQYELIEYEVWYNKDNSALMSKVADSLGEEATGVPYIVIGKESFSGYDDSVGQQMETLIKENYENDVTTDVVAEVNSTDDKVVTTDKKDSKDTNKAVVLIFGAIVLTGLIIFSIKNNK